MRKKKKLNCGNLITKIGGGKREKIKLWQLKCQNRRRGERKELNCDNLIVEIGRERREKKIELWQSHCRNSKRERKTN